MPPQSILSLIDRPTVIPVITLSETAVAIPLARALHRGGLEIVEITLRTACGMEAARLIRRELPEMTVGVGTVLQTDQLLEAVDIGAHFAVSPGLSESLASAAASSGIPFLPGCCTATEVMRATELGFDALKFFPAELAGGPRLLKQFHSLFPGLRFCPTGGISVTTLESYLSLDNVFCVGGSWLAPAPSIREAHWHSIETLAREARELCARYRSGACSDG